MNRVSNNTFLKACMINILILLSLLMRDPIKAAQSSEPLSRKKFEQLLLNLYSDNRLTFLSQLPFDSNGSVSIASSNHCPTAQLPIRWVAIVPLIQFFKTDPCYQEKVCFNQAGESFKGLRCCEKIHPHYYQIRFDPDNYVPEIAPYATQLKSLLAKSLTRGKHPQELPPQLRGFVARTYLKLHYRYQIGLSPDDIAHFQQWDRDYPAMASEKQRQVNITSISR